MGKKFPYKLKCACPTVGGTERQEVPKRFLVLALQKVVKLKRVCKLWAV